MLKILAYLKTLWQRRYKPKHIEQPKPKPMLSRSNRSAYDERFGFVGYEFKSEQPEQPKAAPPPKPSRAIRRANDSEYRKLLKARMKFDKWAKPEGPEPVHHAREPLKEKPAPKVPVVEIVADHGPLIRDHYDLDKKNPEVLFEESEFYGQFNFRDTLLDQLDRYWFYLDRMRRHDRDAYAFYKQVGMQLLPYCTTHTYGKVRKTIKPITPDELVKFIAEIEVPPMFNIMRPTFGCIAFGANPKVEGWEEQTKWIYPRFMYYTKYTKPAPEIQLMTGGDVYKMTVWWDTISNSKRKWGSPTEFAVFIDKTGKHVQILKTCKHDLIPIKEKRGLGIFHIPDHEWHIPEGYEKWAKDNGMDVQTHLSHLFTGVLKQQEYAQYGDLRVQVHKDDMTAIFNIDSRRLGYFFKDRDIELTKDGHRKRVFHIVKPQVRKDGSTVRMHYRGERNFSWAGYQVNITVPGLDHFIQDEMNIGCHDSYWEDNLKKSMGEAEFGKKIVKAMKQGVGGVAR